jgi:hypothetical protein
MTEYFEEVHRKLNLSRDKEYWDRYEKLSKKSTLNLSKKLAKIIGFSKEEIEKQDCLREMVCCGCLALIFEDDYFGKVGILRNCIQNQGEEIYLIDFREKHLIIQININPILFVLTFFSPFARISKLFCNPFLLLLDRENLFKLFHY